MTENATACLAGSNLILEITQPERRYTAVRIGGTCHPIAHDLRQERPCRIVRHGLFHTIALLRAQRAQR